MSRLNIDTVGSPGVMSEGDLSVGCQANSCTTSLFGGIAENSIGSMVGTGTTYADSNIVSYVANIVAGSTGNSGVRLPLDAKVGRRVYIINKGWGGAVTVYPPAGGTLNQLAANTGVSLASAAAAEYIHQGNNKWFVCS